MIPGDIVRVRRNLYGLQTKGRLAQIIDIDDLSSVGAYPDRFTIRMLKSGEEMDTVSESLIFHAPDDTCGHCEGSGIDECNTGVYGVRCRMCGGTGRVKS